MQPGTSRLHLQPSALHHTPLACYACCFRIHGMWNPTFPCLPVQSRLGGGEGVEGIYGSITQTGMQKIFDSMRHNCGLDKSSTLVDIGAGLGR